MSYTRISKCRARTARLQVDNQIRGCQAATYGSWKNRSRPAGMGRDPPRRGPGVGPRAGPALGHLSSGCGQADAPGELPAEHQGHPRDAVVPELRGRRVGSRAEEGRRPVSETLAIIYAAKSTQDKRRSIGTQLEDAREFCEDNGWTVVDPPHKAAYKDEGFSAYSGNRGPDLRAAE